MDREATRSLLAVAARKISDSAEIVRTVSNDGSYPLLIHAITLLEQAEGRILESKP